eukprot:scaffold11118_cov229-Skeletonema_marinoi.AAC.4
MKLQKQNCEGQGGCDDYCKNNDEDEAAADTTDADASSTRVDNSLMNVKKSKLPSHPHLLRMKILNLPQRYAISIASRPIVHLATALILSIALCIVVATKGNPHLDAPGLGFLTKGTTVANRAAQEGAIRRWIETSYSKNEGRSLAEEKDGDDYCSGAWYGSEEMLSPDSINLVNMWKISDSSEMSESALDANALYEMCIAEEHTLNMLSENDFCHKCQVEKKSWSWSTGSATEKEERCIQPYSLVGLARVYVRAQYGYKSLGTQHILPSMSCERLKSAWTATVQREFKEILLECTSYMLKELRLTPPTNLEYSSCKDFPIMTASLVDDLFLDTGRVKYTSSIFATKNDYASVKLMYNAEKGQLLQKPLKNEEYSSSSSFEDNLFDVGMNTLYTTAKQGFYEMYLEGSLPADAAIFSASLIVAVVCVLIHTRSPFLTIMGALQILLTLPLGYFVYYFICGVTFFPFLNINAIFVVFAMGADDIFVVVDIWKTIRHEMPRDLTTDQVALYALPKIAFATFVTSITTAAAFFASTGVKAPIIASWLAQGCRSSWVSLSSMTMPEKMPDTDINEVRRESEDWEKVERGACVISVSECNTSIEVTATVSTQDSASQSSSSSKLEHDTNISDRRTSLLSSYYNLLHYLRWPAALASLGALIGCSYVASKIQPPNVISPGILPSNNRYERHREWSEHLLASKLIGSRDVLFTWGSIAADTSHRMDPSESTLLVYDESFDPSNEAAQAFDDWLAEQSQSTSPTETYSTHCKGATGIPISSDVFHPCLVAYDDLHPNVMFITHEEGLVKTIVIAARSQSSRFSGIEDQDQEFNAIEAWSSREKKDAPNEASSFFFSSNDFHVLDTLINMTSSARASIGIAIICAAAMILLTSRSLTVTMISIFSISYVFVATIACLFGPLGWKLGLFESILLSISIGVGSDFVLHASHSYSMAPDSFVTKEARTRYAVLHIGPSILGSAFTTLSAATFMLFAENQFSRKFGTILIITILHSMIGSFVVFFALCDCFGRSNHKLCGESKNEVPAQRICK